MVNGTAPSLLRCRLFWMPRVAAHAAVTASHHVVANNNAVRGHVLARAAARTFVVDTHSATRKAVVHFLRKLVFESHRHSGSICSIAILHLTNELMHLSSRFVGTARE